MKGRLFKTYTDKNGEQIPVLSHPIGLARLMYVAHAIAKENYPNFNEDKWFSQVEEIPSFYDPYFRQLEMQAKHSKISTIANDLDGPVKHKSTHMIRLFVADLAVGFSMTNGERRLYLLLRKFPLKEPNEDHAGTPRSLQDHPRRLPAGNTRPGS